LESGDVDDKAKFQGLHALMHDIEKEQAPSPEDERMDIVDEVNNKDMYTFDGVEVVFAQEVEDSANNMEMGEECRSICTQNSFDLASLMALH